MGFSYSYWGLCCDFCGAQRNTRKYVKKIACPYGYCQAWACCDVCRAEKKHMACSCTREEKTHKEHCKAASEKFNHQQWLKQEIETAKLQNNSEALASLQNELNELTS